MEPQIGDLRNQLFADFVEAKSVADAGHRRYRAWGHDFDTRANMLSIGIQENWEKGIKEQWEKNKNEISRGLEIEFGSKDAGQKRQNFIDIGEKPISIVSFHNAFFSHVRDSFTIGAYYPALTGACAMGERILNHLVIDLRDFHRSTKQYKEVHGKSSFQNWGTAIDVLLEWDVISGELSKEFKSLEDLRHRSIHFNVETYESVREDALRAIEHLRKIITGQFGCFGTQRWFIPGTKGATFIKKAYEEHPFIQTYFMPQCPFVGILHGVEFKAQGQVEFRDKNDYGSGSLSDEEFRDAFNERDTNQVVK